jgi:1A family penicillin-binding protein
MQNIRNLLKHCLLGVLRFTAQTLVALGRFVLFLFRVTSKIFSMLSNFSVSSYRKVQPKVSDYFTKLIKSLSRLSKIRFTIPKITILNKSQTSLIRTFFMKLRIFTFGMLFSFTFIFVPYQIWVWYTQLPSPGLLVEYGKNRSTKILDRNGRLLYEIYVDRKYNPVTLKEIPDHVVHATLAIEDDQFYTHRGFRVDSIMRAAKATVLEDDLQGASTITQQLIKNVLLTPERTISRKVKELVLSVLVETKYSKNEILELYLNNIAYGGTAWGIESASQKFFGKHVWDLSLAESTMLAGLPTAPSVYSPLRDKDVSKRRQKLVLDRMVLLGYISEEEAKGAFGQKLEFASQADYINAAHFVAHVRSILEEKFGERYVGFGGLTVTTTLDLDLQEKVQEIVRRGVEKSSHLSISNGAAIILDPKTSEILAYVGSVDYFGGSWGAYDVITAFRQPGSSIKPITYALAFEKGYTPASIISDTPVKYVSFDEVYSPINYDGRFHGDVTLREALANSYNVPAVKLIKNVGVDDMVSLGRNLGLRGWEVDDSYGLSVTLGGKEVRLLDHANVYATLARGGVYKKPTPFLSVKDLYGYELYKPDVNTQRQVISEEVTYLISNILSDNHSRTPAFGAHSSLVIPGRNVAVKTGTTDLKRDNWTLGYTPSVVVGVWVGNNDNSPMNQYLASGLSGAAPIWSEIMRMILENKKSEFFAIPEGVIIKIDPECGGRAEVFVKDSNIPEHLCLKDKEKDEGED